MKEAENKYTHKIIEKGFQNVIFWGSLKECEERLNNSKHKELYEIVPIHNILLK